MLRYIYGNRMFIGDLIFVSIWALFFSRYSYGPAVWLLIPIRIALSFEMKRRSPWTIISAIGFLVAYIFAGCIGKPFEKMACIFLCAIGRTATINNTFPHPAEVWLESVSIIGFLWLAVLPVVVGLCLHPIKYIQWKRKWIWIYIIPLTALSVWIMVDEGPVGGFLLGLAVALLPLVYWSIYNRRGRSPVQLAINNRNVRWYIIYSALMLASLTVGVKDIYSLKLIGLLIFPPLFYIILTIYLRLGTVLTRCCIALSVSGLLYHLTLHYGNPESIVMLTFAVALIIYVGVTMVLNNKRWTAALTLVIIVSFVIIPSTLGFNPYIVLDAERTRMYVSNPSVRQGVYVVERYAELAEEGTPDYWRMKHGLRDRYGLILPTEYDELTVIDGDGRYIATNYNLKHGSPKSDQRYGIFDLRGRKFIVDPDKIKVMEIERIDDKSLRLINPYGIPFATLHLPGEYRGVYSPDCRLELNNIPPVMESVE